MFPIFKNPSLFPREEPCLQTSLIDSSQMFRYTPSYRRFRTQTAPVSCHFLHIPQDPVLINSPGNFSCVGKALVMGQLLAPSLESSQRKDAFASLALVPPHGIYFTRVVINQHSGNTCADLDPLFLCPG